jgi:membrane protein YqaA with SNARE-associated domain
MKRLVVWAQGFALGIGGLGLFLIAVLDASFVSLPEVNDILIVYMTVKQPSLMLYFALMATLGSVVGSMAIYYIGRKGGEAMLRRRFSGPRSEKTLNAFRRYGVAAVIVPSMLPPPMPFKIFVFGAGVAGMSPTTFASCVGVGRGVRYLLVGVAAYYFGDAALEYIRSHGNEVAVGMALTCALGLGLYYWRRQRRRQPAEV